MTTAFHSSKKPSVSFILDKTAIHPNKISLPNRSGAYKDTHTLSSKPTLSIPTSSSEHQVSHHQSRIQIKSANTKGGSRSTWRHPIPSPYPLPSTGDVERKRTASPRSDGVSSPFLSSSNAYDDEEDTDDETALTSSSSENDDDDNDDDEENDSEHYIHNSFSPSSSPLMTPSSSGSPIQTPNMSPSSVTTSATSIVSTSPTHQRSTSKTPSASSKSPSKNTSLNNNECADVITKTQVMKLSHPKSSIMNTSTNTQNDSEHHSTKSNATATRKVTPKETARGQGRGRGLMRRFSLDEGE